MAQRKRLSTHKPWTLVVCEPHFQKLHAHLFPGDGDEHGAAILAGIVETEREIRLLVREVILAIDGHDFVEGERSYRQLQAAFTMPLINVAREESLVYLAIHNHGGEYSVAFSQIDLDSHRRNYPALLAINRGTPVGALVFARRAVAGSIWLDRDTQVELEHTVILGRNREIIRPKPVNEQKTTSNTTFNRQVQLIGQEGQHRLRSLSVGVIGAGGVGLSLVEYLGRLGVGEIVVVDPDIVEKSNLPRLIGTPRDAHRSKLRRRGWRLTFRPMFKVEVCEHILKRLPFFVKLRKFAQSAEELAPFRALKSCDYIFHAADTATSRYFLNALLHQYLIPGVQVGSKIRVDASNDQIREGTSIVRRILLTEGCLLCRGVVDAQRLQLESMSPSDREAQNYLEGTNESAPSVLTVNSIGVSEAIQSFLLHATQLWPKTKSTSYYKQDVFSGEVSSHTARPSPHCPHCSQIPNSRFARGDYSSAPPPIGPAP